MADDPLASLNNLLNVGANQQAKQFKLQTSALKNTVFSKAQTDALIGQVGTISSQLGVGSGDGTLMGALGPAGGVFADVMAQLSAGAEGSSRRQAGSIVNQTGGAGFASAARVDNVLAGAGANAGAAQAGLLLDELNRQRDFRFENQNSILGALQLAVGEQNLRATAAPNTGLVAQVQDAIGAATMLPEQLRSANLQNELTGIELQRQTQTPKQRLYGIIPRSKEERVSQIENAGPGWTGW